MAGGKVEPEDLRKIFISGLDIDTTDEVLQSWCAEKVGADYVQDVKLVKREKTKTSIGFVTLKTIETVDNFLLTKEGVKFNEKEVVIKRAVPRDFNHTSAHEKTKKLFVANLPKKDYSEDDLKQHIEQNMTNPNFGVIESVQFVREKDENGTPTGESKGYGFVECSHEDMADKLSIEFKKFNAGGREAELKKSLPPESRNRTRGGFNPRGGAKNGRGYPMYPQFGYGYDGYYGGGGYADPYGYNAGYGGGWGAPQGRGGRGGY